MPATPTRVELKPGRTLLHEDDFLVLTARIAAAHPRLDPPTAARIADQTLAFLAACAVATEPIGPSDLVDIGWHAFLLDTAGYAAFCERVAGRFIHHVPDASSPAPGERVPLRRAVTAITVAGYQVDPDLWGDVDGPDRARCTQCHAGCHDSPTGGTA